MLSTKIMIYIISLLENLATFQHSLRRKWMSARQLIGVHSMRWVGCYRKWRNWRCR